MKKLLVSLVLLVMVVSFLFVASSEGKDQKKPQKKEETQEKVIETNQPGQEEVAVEPQLFSNQLSLDRIVQENGYFCACACAQATLRFLGIEESQSVLAQKMETSSVTGTEYPEFVQVMNSYLMGHSIPASYSLRRVSASEDFESVKAELSNHIKTNIDDGYPVFVMVNLNTLYPEMISINHMVLVQGYSGLNGAIDHVTIMDPYYKVEASRNIFTLDTITEAIFKNEEPGFIW